MAHRISIQNGKAEFSYVSQTPWHGLGEQAQHETPQEAQVRVLPWTVSTRPVAFPMIEGGAFDKVAEGVRVIVRDDSHSHLGVATGSYQPIQNAQAAEVADALIAEGAKCVETIGALDGGARCFMLLSLDKTGFEVKGSAVLPYFLLRWGHDGRTPVSGKLTNVYVVCHNTLTAAGSSYAFNVKHTANAKLRIEEAQQALGVARKAYSETRKQYAALAGAALKPQAAKDYFHGVFPAPQAELDAYLLEGKQSEKLDRWNAVQARLLALYSGEGKGSLANGPSAWGAYNAVTEYLDHVYPVLASGKVSADRQQSVLFGAYADVRDAAYKSALALV